MFTALLLIGQLALISPVKEAEIKIKVSRKDHYCLLTRKEPMSFEVTGPTWIRVYTRIPWGKDFGKTAKYKFILVKDETDEKFITKETEMSRSAEWEGVRLSKWRSFYIFVPEGKHKYEVVLWRGPSDTMLVKITFEAPGKYRELAPSNKTSILELVQNERIVKYYEITPDNPLRFEVDGPTRMKVTVRGNLKNLAEKIVYTLSVYSNGKLIKESTFSGSPSQTCYYSNAKNLIPSTPSTLYISLKKGKHIMDFKIKGVESGAIRVQVLEK